MRPVAVSVRSEVPRPQLDPLRRSLCNLNEPAPSFATLGYLHGPPPGESPIGAWATRSPAKRRASDRTEPQTEPDVTPGPALPTRFLRHSSGVRWCPQKKPPGGWNLQGGCTSGAPSAWVFLVRLHACRAGLRFPRPGEYSQALGRHKAKRRRFAWERQREQSVARHALGKDASRHEGRMPLKSQK